MAPGLGKRELDRQRTSAAIRTAALDLFARDGYATTVERIAEASGVTQRTFFRYFPHTEAVSLGDGLQALLVALLRGRPCGEPDVIESFSAVTSSHPCAPDDFAVAEVVVLLESDELYAATSIPATTISAAPDTMDLFLERMMFLSRRPVSRRDTDRATYVASGAGPSSASAS
jgi:AcrR family transcriptional regulator